MKKFIILTLACIILSGCSNSKAESTFECFDAHGNKDSITLTYEDDEYGRRIFYDGEIKIGNRSQAIDFRLFI